MVFAPENQRNDQVREYRRGEAAVFLKTREAFGGLSNMAPGFPLRVNGVVIRTSEALYQACRFPHLPELQAKIIEQTSPMTAKMVGKPFRGDSRPDWDRVRTKVMRWCLRVKLAQNYEGFSALLRSTGDRPIVEQSSKDDFWGARPIDGDGLVGQNVLGRLLMELRERVRTVDAAELRIVEPLAIPDFLLLGRDIEAIGSPSMPASRAMAERPSPPPQAPPEKTDTSMNRPTISAARKKLIEVSLPLEAINKASAREKSIRHGHPSTLHLWWARRPLAACRAVIFAQLVDDPSAWPDRFPTKAAQDAERERLHKVIAEMVEWPASKAEDQARWEAALDAARAEIARSFAWGRGEEPPTRRGEVLAYLAEHAPPVYDPFCGGGSIPLEAQRLGLKAYGSDLNPVAVLISKALVEIPPKFAGLTPVNPEAKKDIDWRGARGLAEDVRAYGRWMRDEAKKRIGHLYPDATLPNGEKATVIAWLWARTVRSPDPSAKGAMVPLAASFVLSSKEGKEAIVRVVRDAAAPDGWRFEVQQGGVSAADLKAADGGTKSAPGNFICAITGAPVEARYIQAEGQAGRLSQRLMAIVAEGSRQRVYFSPTTEHEAAIQEENGALELAAESRSTFLSGSTPAKLTGGTCHIYGLNTWGKLFTDRQLVALTTFSDLVGEAREKVRADAEAAFRARGLPLDPTPLADGGQGPHAYADAVATYLAFLVSKAADRNSTICSWDSGPVGSKSSTGGSARTASVRNTFARQALPMTWDFAECSLFSESGGGFQSGLDWIAPAIENSPAMSEGAAFQVDAPANSYPVRPVAISTDPPYYDNIGYADLSDFFYVWLRRSLGGVWPDLFRRLQTPKAEELVATPYRALDLAAMTERVGRADHPLLKNWEKLSPKDRAEREFMFGMCKALEAMRNAAAPDVPLAIYYAFKQSEKSEDGVSSPGWASFLQAVVDSGLMVDGTWPIRTELSNRMIGMGANALASSVVLVCRPRPDTARAITRRDFIAELRRDLPDALAKMKQAGLHPVDIPQAALGPGMAVFSKYAIVREPDDSAMPVGKAIPLINQVRGEIDHVESGELDAGTRFALDWFASYGWEAKPSGQAIQLSQSYDLTLAQLTAGDGVLITTGGDARLRRRDELRADWSPSTDRTLTAWELAQAMNRALNDGGGVAAAAKLLGEARHLEFPVSWLCGRLFGIAEDRKLSEEARGWGVLSEAWEQIQAAVAKAPNPAAAAPMQGDMLT